MDERTIYGDGSNEVTVTEAEVMLSDGTGSVVVLSRAAFREVCIGWHRLLDQEESAEE